LITRHAIAAAITCFMPLNICFIRYDDILLIIIYAEVTTLPLMPLYY